MKQFGMRQVPRAVLEKATCDTCGNDCTNSHFDVLIQASFSESPDLLKTVCWECYERDYKQDVHAVRQKKQEAVFGKLLA